MSQPKACPRNTAGLPLASSNCAPLTLSCPCRSTGVMRSLAGGMLVSVSSFSPFPCGGGAVTGALAGARFGASGIPQRWLEPLMRKEVVSGLANRLTRS